MRAACSTIGAYEPDIDAPGQYKNGRTFQPSICPVPTPAAFVRLEVARWTGMSGLATEPSKTGATRLSSAALL